jgi:hypothetical protein
MARNEPLKKRIHPAIALAAIIAAGLVVRLVFLVQLERSEFGGVLSLDSRFYYDLARAISEGGAPPAGALDFNPLYPAFLVVVFKLFGAGLSAPRIVQFALGLFTIALVYAAGARLVEGPRKGKPSGAVTAFAAAAMTLLYRQFVLYEGTIIAIGRYVFGHGGFRSGFRVFCSARSLGPAPSAGRTSSCSSSRPFRSGYC